MIANKQELREYWEADASSNHFSWYSKYTNAICMYLRQLRRVEYLRNRFGYGIIHRFALRRLSILGLKTGFSIPPNVFGKGLCLPHHGTIVVNGSARFGENCMVQCGVNISESVVCGNHIFLGAGCKLMNDVHLCDDTIVGANAVVTRSFDEANIVVAGIPAKKLSQNGWKHRDRF